MKTTYLGLILFLMIFWSCEDPETLADPYFEDTDSSPAPTPTYSSGTADFSRFVAVGNSLTAGYSDGALFASGQEVSFPNILAGQFALAGGGAFTQPLMNDNIGGLLLGGNQIAATRLFFDLSTQLPANVSGTPTTEVSNIINGPFNNMGVPGAKSYHLLANGYGNVAGVAVGTANPYFARMATSSSASIMEDVMAQNPTFFSLWIGNNDVLGFASSGGAGVDHNQTGNLDPSTYGGNDITNAMVFGQVYSGLVQTLTSGGADGIVANIPNVTDAPYFTTVPYAPLDPTNPAFGPQIPTLNGVFGQLNQVYAYLQSVGAISNAAERSIVFSTTSASAVVIKDEALTDISVQVAGVLSASPTFPAFVQSLGLPAAAAPLVANLLGTTYGQTRQATSSDLLVLPSRSVIGTVNQTTYANLQSQGIPAAIAGQFSIEGITNPLADRWVLIPSETTAILNATAAFNQVISNVAAQYELPLFDANAFLNLVANGGVSAGSATITSAYVTGGAFSLDGVHPSPRGYAVVANQMIDLINATYGSNIPKVNPIEYTGLYIN